MLASFLGLGQAGCVSRATMERCHQTSKALQAEVAQLRDLDARQRAENRDLVDRALAENERVRDLETLLARYEQEVAGYREDRDQLAAQVDRIVRVARGDGTRAAGLRDRLATFVAGHPGTRFDPERLVVEVPLARLLSPDTGRLTPSGGLWLDELAGGLAGLDPGEWRIELPVVGLGAGAEAESDEVRRASFDGDGAEAGPPSAAAEAIRARLALAASRPPEQFGLAARDPGEAGPARFRLRLEARAARGPRPGP